MFMTTLTALFYPSPKLNIKFLFEKKSILKYNSLHCLTVDRDVKKSVTFFSVGEQPQLLN